jgi:Big-like domain-containing protein
MTRNNVCKLALVSLFLLTAVCTSLAQPAVAPTTDPANGYPLWYEDANGLRVEPCLNSADPFCVLLADPGFNPANPVVFPTNFPVEYFYFVADSDKLTTPGCPAAGVSPGIAKWRGALEGSFLNGTVIPGDQMTFTRTKIVAGGLCPNTTYVFTTPYGADSVTTNASGQVVANKKGATIDIGCAAAPCDFSAVLPSRVMGAFLQFDPAVTVPPPGYLGDNGTLSPIIGSPTGTNVFSVSLGGAVLATTNLFTVAGRIAGPLMAAPSSIDFSGQVQGTSSAPKTVSITNVYSAAITISGISFTAVPADFAVANDTCTGATLARDQICTVGVVFTPSLIAVENGQMQIAHNGPFRSPLNVDLKGTGIAGAAAPSVTLSASSLSFPNTRVRMQSPGQTINVSNIGNAPLLGTASIVNADPNVFPPAANQFLITNDGCSNISVAAGSSCSVTVIFDPSSSGPANAVLRFDNNAPTSPQSVTLAGNATGGLAAVSTQANPPGLDAFGFPDWYQDENAVQLQPCLNPAEPCVLLADPGYNPALPLALPGNFPVEFFYFVADSDKMDVPGCPASGFSGGKVTYRAALEGSFPVAPPAPGGQITFTRTKIVVSPGGLCPNTTYAFTHPYGTDLITTDAAGGVVANKKGATTDVGCVGPPCNFADALSSRVMGGFVKWDPAVAPLAPAGFIGDAGGAVGTPHAVVGSPYLDPISGTPANFLRISDPITGVVLNGCKDALGAAGPCQVNLFTVSGKLAGPISASPSPINFAAQAIGSTSAPQIVTLTNNDPAAVININTVSFILANKGDYSVPAGADNCTGAVLNPAGFCTIGIAFTPHVVGASFAGLSVSFASGGSTAGLNTPVQVPLLGTGIAANQPPVAVNDSATTSANSGRILITVLANDSDPDGNVPLIVGSFTQPLNGVVFLEPTQDISYTPNPGFSGTDTFFYQAQDSLGALSNVATVTVTVGALSATTTSITAPAVTYPASGAVTVSVSSGAGIPAGNVSLSVDGGAALNAALDAAGNASFSIAGLAAGSHSLSASYASQGTFAASSASGSLTVNPAATSVGINAPAITYNANGSVTVTVSSAAGVPGGNVSLSVDGGAATSRALVNGATTFTITRPAAGNHTLSASYAAQGNFAASTGNGTLTVNPAATSMTISAPTISFGANGFVTVSVTSAAGVVIGNVSLAVDGALPVTQPLNNGSSTFTVFTPSVGNHNLVASYAVQGNFSSSGAIGTLIVNPAAANENITATAQASRNKQLTQASWTVQGTTSIRTVHTMAITLTRTGSLIGTATTDTKGQWKMSAGKSPIVPIPGDTVTVTSSLGTVKVFSVQVK